MPSSQSYIYIYKIPPVRKRENTLQSNPSKKNLSTAITYSLSLNLKKDERKEKKEERHL